MVYFVMVDERAIILFILTGGYFVIIRENKPTVRNERDIIYFVQFNIFADCRICTAYSNF